MKHSLSKALGDPEAFVQQVPALASELEKIRNLEHVELKHMREAVAARDYDITTDPVFCRALFGGFAAILIDWCAQDIVVKGLFKKTVVVQSKGFSCEFVDLFYRCVFEGLDLTPEGEGLAR